MEVHKREREESCAVFVDEVEGQKHRLESVGL